MGTLKEHIFKNVLLASSVVSFFLYSPSEVYASSSENFNNNRQNQQEQFVPFQFVPSQVNLNVEETFGIGIEIEEKAKEHHTRFPLYALHTQDLMNIIDYDRPFNSFSLQESYGLAWNELMHRRTSSVDADGRAGAKLGLAKLIMDRCYLPQNMSKEECYDLIYDYLSQVIHTHSNIEQKKRSHARIWQALMIMKLNLNLKNKSRGESLQHAWDLLEKAYKDQATDSTLVFMFELIVRYRLQPGNCSVKEAFEKAKELFHQIGKRSHKKAIQSVITAKTKEPIHKKDKWHLARSAFLVDVKKIIGELDDELTRLEKDYQNNPSFEFHPLNHQSEMEKRNEDLEEIQQVSDSNQQVLPLELNQVLHLINPSNPELIRAFDPENGNYIFFNDYDVSGFGNNCGFNCLGISRKQAQQFLLAHSSDQQIRALVAPQFCRDLLVVDNNATALLKMLSQLPAFKKLSTSQIIEVITSNTEGVLNQNGIVAQQFALNEQIYKDYITYALSGNRMLEYQPGESSIIDALAEILNLNLEIWTMATSSQLEETINDERFRHTLELRHQFQARNPIRTLRLHHMTQATEGMNHFRVILPTNQLSYRNNGEQQISQILINEEETQESDQEINISSVTQTVITNSYVIFEEEGEDSSNEELEINKKKRSREVFEEREETEAEYSQAKQRKLSEEEKEKIYSLHQQGKTNEQIMAKTKVDMHKVAEVLEEYGVTKKKYRKRLNPKQKQQIDSLTTHIQKYDQITLENSRKIAHQVKCNPRQVEIYLKSRIRGIAKPLSQEQKSKIKKLAFTKEGVRKSEVTASTIAKKLGQGVTRSQVDNYIRCLLKQDSYRWEESESSSDF
jgi:hypothetical protein